MDCGLLCDFYEKCIQEAKASGVLFSLHLKATTMKVSNPIMRGHCIRCTSRTCSASTRTRLRSVGDVYKKIASLPEAEMNAIEDGVLATYPNRADEAQVGLARSIVYLHGPSGIIIDNSVNGPHGQPCPRAGAGGAAAASPCSMPPRTGAAAEGALCSRLGAGSR